MPIISWQTCERNGTTGGGSPWKQICDSRRIPWKHKSQKLGVEIWEIWVF